MDMPCSHFYSAPLSTYFLHKLPASSPVKFSSVTALLYAPAFKTSSHLCLLPDSLSPLIVVTNVHLSNSPLHLRNLRLLSPILTPCRNPTYNTPQITHSPHKMIPHTRTILASSSPHHNNTMLLHIMSNPWYVRAYHTPRAKAHLGRFALARVRFFGLSNTYF